MVLRIKARHTLKQNVKSGPLTKGQYMELWCFFVVSLSEYFIKNRVVDDSRSNDSYVWSHKAIFGRIKYI